MTKRTQTIFNSTVLPGLLGLVIAGCQPAVSGEYSFPEGDAAAGQKAFTDLGCHTCHSVTGAPEIRDGLNAAERTIPLGGEQTTVYTYGELVTAIINPTHQVSQSRLGTMVANDGESLMRSYNDIMTVSQLADLVTFLEQHYTLKPFDRTDYRSYTPF